MLEDLKQSENFNQNFVKITKINLTHLNLLKIL